MSEVTKKNVYTVPFLKYSSISLILTYYRLYWYRGETVRYTAGLGYLEELKLFTQILLLGQLASVRTVNSQWGEKDY